MCLIAFSYKQHPNYPLIMVANRDEIYSRPSKPLAPWESNSSIIGGIDTQAGGSWLAAASSGRLAAVTNHRDGNRPNNPDSLSRGALIHDYLTSPTPPSQFRQQLEASKQLYNGFNLLLLDKEELHHISNRNPNNGPLPSGIYGLSNATLNTPWPKTTELQQRLTNFIDQPLINTEEMLELMQHSRQADKLQLPKTGISEEWELKLSSCFIQTETYGTRASTAILLDQHGRMTLHEQRYNVLGPTGSSLLELQIS